MGVRKCLITDAVSLIVYAVVANPAVTGIPFHEWLGVGLFVLFVVHAFQHYDWIVETLQIRRSGSTWQRRAHLMLDVLIVFAFMVCTVSGLMVSGSVLPFFGLFADGYYFWNPLHAMSAKMLLALLMLHIVFHARMLVRVFRSRGLKGQVGEETS